MTTQNGKIEVRFWGVRGSIAAPSTPEEVEDKVAYAVHAACNHAAPPQGLDLNAAREWVRQNLPFHQRSTFGGDTTCVEIRCGDEILVFDMGTGMRRFGNSLMRDIFAKKGVRLHVFQSHVHWDHIQGFPFFTPIFLPRAAFPNNRIAFYGGMAWESSLDHVLEGQMDAPVFPVNLKELMRTGPQMSFEPVDDGQVISLGDEGQIKVTVRKLHHPQVTFGFRVEYAGRSVAFCTDHEPYAGNVLDRKLVQLAEGTDLFITDCQYTLDEYAGANNGPQKIGWGHSFPEYIALAAKAAKCRRVVTTHHDPASTDARVVQIAQAVADIGGIETTPADQRLIIAV